MKINIHQTVLVLLLLTATSALAADFDKGKKAYDKGDYKTALQEWRPLAEQGNAKAQHNLGVMYRDGEGVPEDYSQAVSWFRKAAEQGLAEAQSDLGYAYFYGYGVPEDDAQAVFWFRKAAEQDNAEAQYGLGTAYFYGYGIPEDNVQTVFWYRKAAEQGNADAQFDLGRLYDAGEGVSEDDVQAVFWYRKAAKQGNADAQVNLGGMYYGGEGVPKDNNQAMSWFRKAAEQGNARAQGILGMMYDEGEGVPEDNVRAVSYFRKAAEQGLAGAQFYLGTMYDEGEGVPLDDEQAVFWYRRAAEQGHARAQRYLGLMYDEGEGIPEDDGQAVFWYRKAAEQGDGASQFNLGLAYYRGEGVPEDNVQAYAWFNLAAAQGNEYVKERASESRDITRQHMISSQIAEAQKLSREIAARIERNQSGSDSSSFADTLDSVFKSELEGNGSGFVIGRDGETTFIVTNYHVVEDCAKVTVVYAGKSYEASVQAKDANSDLALLETNFPPAQPASFSSLSRVNLGEAVTAAGYPLQGLLSKSLNVTGGNVSALAGLGDDAKHLQITAPLQPGNSGGPLLDASGNVVGVAASKLNAIAAAELTGDLPQNVNFAIKAALVRSFLDIHGVDYQRLPSERKLAPEKLAERARQFTVAVHCWK